MLDILQQLKLQTGLLFHDICSETEHPGLSELLYVNVSTLF